MFRSGLLCNTTPRHLRVDFKGLCTSRWMSWRGAFTTAQLQVSTWVDKWQALLSGLWPRPTIDHSLLPPSRVRIASIRGDIRRQWAGKCEKPTSNHWPRPLGALRAPIERQSITGPLTGDNQMTIGQRGPGSPAAPDTCARWPGDALVKFHGNYWSPSGWTPPCFPGVETVKQSMLAKPQGLIKTSWSIRDS